MTSPFGHYTHTGQKMHLSSSNYLVTPSLEMAKGVWLEKNVEDSTKVEPNTYRLESGLALSCDESETQSTR